MKKKELKSKFEKILGEELKFVEGSKLKEVAIRLTYEILSEIREYHQECIISEEEICLIRDVNELKKYHREKNITALREAVGEALVIQTQSYERPTTEGVRNDLVYSTKTSVILIED